MPVSFTAQDGRDPVQSLKALTQDILPSPVKMQQAGQAQISRIQQRTANGVDANGNPFAPYATSTTKARTRKGLPTSPVDLRVNGQLLDTMRVEVLNDHQFAVVLNNDQAGVIAAALNDGTSRMPARHFFATSQTELEQLLADLRS